jgi:hypothetical protein
MIGLEAYFLEGRPTVMQISICVKGPSERVAINSVPHNM